MLSPRSYSRFIGRFRSARHSKARQPVKSPYAVMAEGPAQHHQCGSNLLPSGPASPASPSFLARCQSAKDSFIASRSKSSIHCAPTPSHSRINSSKFPHRSRSAREGSHTLLPGSCDDSRCPCQTVPKSVGGIQYKTRIRGFMRPRRSASQSASLSDCQGPSSAESPALSDQSFATATM